MDQQKKTVQEQKKGKIFIVQDYSLDIGVTLKQAYEVAASSNLTLCKKAWLFLYYLQKILHAHATDIQNKSMTLKSVRLI